MLIYASFIIFITFILIIILVLENGMNLNFFVVLVILFASFHQAKKFYFLKILRKND